MVILPSLIAPTVQRCIICAFFCAILIFSSPLALNAQTGLQGEAALARVSSLTADDGILVITEAYRSFGCRLERRPGVEEAFESETRSVFKKITGVSVTESREITAIYNKLMNIAALRMSRENQIKFTKNAVVLVNCRKR